MEPVKTPFGSDLISLLTTGVQSMKDDWFGPGEPLRPVAPEDLKTRVFDFPFATNLQYQPKSTANDGVSFAQLRALADNYDLLRIIIETRKDQVVSMPWTFRLRTKAGESGQARASRSISDARVQEMNEFWRYPDRQNDFATWLRMFLEEVFVVDALSIAPRWSLANTIYGFDVIDGTTIKRLIDGDGRTPATGPAYQQILKGLPAKDLSIDQLIYRPRNPRAHKVYGYSPVEQIIITVNMALRRQLTQLAHFTEGNVPEALAQVPDKWTPQDIKSFQEMFDAMAGNLAKKSRMRFVPALEGIVFSKEKMLADQFDEWLARIVCFCFSISPQPFSKMMNRATAETAAKAAASEGLIPTLNYISSVLTFIVNRYFGYQDIEHAFMSEEEQDRLKQAQIDKIYASYGKESVDEQRQRDGQEPVGIGHMFFGTAPTAVGPYLNGGNPSDPAVTPAPGNEDEDESEEEDAEKVRRKVFGKASKKV
jgi:PAS domain-containing protein